MSYSYVSKKKKNIYIYIYIKVLLFSKKFFFKKMYCIAFVAGLKERKPITAIFLFR